MCFLGAGLHLIQNDEIAFLFAPPYGKAPRHSKKLASLGQRDELPLFR